MTLQEGAWQRPLEPNVNFHSLYLDGVYLIRGAFGRPVFVPAGPSNTTKVSSVQRDAIVRTCRVLAAHDLCPMALGLPAA